MTSTLGPRMVRMLLATLLVTGGMVAVTESPALASACPASTCTGYDPYRHGCTKGSHQSKPVTFQGVTVANVTNWYSANCVANWAEGSLTTAGVQRGLSVTLNIGLTGVFMMCYYNVTQSDRGASFEACELPYYNKTINAWTDMVDGSGFICAYASVFVKNGSGYTRVATSQSACQ